MNENQIIKKLISDLNYYRHAYYNENQSLVSDKEYDELFDKLKALEDKTALLSMDKTKSIDDLVKFVGGKDVLIMAKADGLTNELIYDKGKLIQGSTRGNGEIGEEITHNCMTYKNIPLEIPFKGYLRLSGESVILVNDFKKINSKLPKEEQYKTPRNLTSGSVRQLDSKICNERNVNFYAFNMLEIDWLKFDSKYKQLEFLQEQGFETVPNTLLIKPKNHMINQVIKDTKWYCEDIGFPIDGMVITYDNIEYSKSLGRTGHHYLDGIAYKFEDETAITTLKDIEWSVGRTGVITPVAIFKTVDLDGTEVSRASLHNLTIMRNFELGIGDEIEVYKANMIIPQVLGNKTRSNNIIIPSKCPQCHGHAIQQTLNDSTVLKCINEHCPSKKLAKFSHFVSRDAMNIDGLSESTLEKFIDLKLIQSFRDIYNLHMHKSTITNIDGIGERSFNKLIEAINKSKTIKLESFIYALGIPNIGKNSSKILAKNFNNDWDLFEDAILSGYDFSQLQDFGNISCDSIYEWYNNVDERDMWVGLPNKMEFIKTFENKATTHHHLFKNTKIYATGTFANYKKEEIKAVIEGLGAEFANGYAKSLDYLIVGSIKGSSKEDKAKADGVKILTEEEFRGMI